MNKQKKDRNQKEENRERNVSIPVVEEDVKIGKRTVERGGVHVERTVEEQPVEREVQLREEHVNVERHPADRLATERDLSSLQEGSMDIIEMAEEPVVAKEARVIGEVEINREMSERTETVHGSARRADVNVEPIEGATHKHSADRGQMPAQGRRYEMSQPGEERIPDDLYKLDDLDNFELSDEEPDIRGWDMLGRDDQKVGEVKSLLASPSAHKAYFAIVEAGDWLQHKRFAVPLSEVQFDEDNNNVRGSFIREQFRNAPEYKENEHDYNRYYGYWHGSPSSPSASTGR